jgi:crotonobetainyl-CoA:carnitine CoA-transferase CaiB-like acyl-CoA transferase
MSDGLGDGMGDGISDAVTDKSGDGDTDDEHGALHGIRVVEAGLLVQGPQAAALLAQLGASVTKVELPGVGDQARWLPISWDDRRSPFYLGCNRGKRSATIDLRMPAGRDAFLRVVATVDVVITNFMPGTMEGWGLGYEDVSAVNPGIVYATGSAFGPVGPDAERAGADLSAQASAGLISGIGADDTPPSPVPVTVADHIASLNIVAGVQAALLARARTGRGQRVDVSLLGSQIWAQASEYTAFLVSGSLAGRANRGHPLIAGIYGIFPTTDGWIAVVGVVPDDRPRFYAAIGRPEIADDPRFKSLLVFGETKQALFEVLDDVFRQRPTGEWCEVLHKAGFRYAPVRDYREVLADQQPWDNGYLQTGRDADGTERTIVGTPITMSATPARAGGPAPELGAHTEEVLLEAGYTWEEIGALQEAGAI